MLQGGFGDFIGLLLYSKSLNNEEEAAIPSLESQLSILSLSLEVAQQKEE